MLQLLNLQMVLAVILRALSAGPEGEGLGAIGERVDGSGVLVREFFWACLALLLTMRGGRSQYLEGTGLYEEQTEWRDQPDVECDTAAEQFLAQYIGWIIAGALLFIALTIINYSRIKALVMRAIPAPFCAILCTSAQFF